MNFNWLTVVLLFQTLVLAAATTPSVKWMQFGDDEETFPICQWLVKHPGNKCDCHMIDGIPKCKVGDKFECIPEPARKNCRIVCARDYVSYYNVEFAAYASCTENRKLPLAWHGRCYPLSNWEELYKECHGKQDSSPSEMSSSWRHTSGGESMRSRKKLGRHRSNDDD